MDRMPRATGLNVQKGSAGNLALGLAELFKEYVIEICLSFGVR